MNKPTVSKDTHAKLIISLQTMISVEENKQLTEQVRPLLIQEKPLLRLPASQKKIVIVGDVHGDFATVKHIVKKYPIPEHILIFVGDYVDRAPEPGNSLHVLHLLFTLKVQFPNNILLLRGNHEFKLLNKKYGFYEELQTIYHSEDVWQMWSAIFELLPLAVLIDNELLIVHAGIPDITTLEEINTIPKGLQIKENKLLDQLVWNDYSPSITTRQWGSRGLETTFIAGEDDFLQSITTLHIRKLIRGHQPSVKGTLFQGKCITLQTCQKYKDYPKEALPHRMKGNLIVEYANSKEETITLPV